MMPWANSTITKIGFHMALLKCNYKDCPRAIFNVGSCLGHSHCWVAQSSSLLSLRWPQILFPLDSSACPHLQLSGMHHRSQKVGLFTMGSTAHTCAVGSWMWSRKEWQLAAHNEHTSNRDPKTNEETVQVRMALDPWTDECPFFKSQNLQYL